MDDTPLTPLRFAPIFKPTPWGGTRLARFVGGDAPPGPVGEAWVLSDQGDNVSRVTEGRYAGRTLRDLLRAAPKRILGRALSPHGRFPLLLKFLDANEPLSVQVHPNDEQAAKFAPADPAAQGKTEAWVVLKAETHSALWAGLRPGVGPEELARATAENVPQLLHTVRPQEGDCLYLPAGTVHAIGAGLMLFEVQQTSDLTFRLHDWGRVDATTGQPRPLHIEQGLACIDFSRGPCEPVRPKSEESDRVIRESLVKCNHFRLWRWQAERPFVAGTGGACRILVGIEGTSVVLSGGRDYPLGPGQVLLLPAEVGACVVRPAGTVTLLECGLPERVARRIEKAA